MHVKTVSERSFESDRFLQGNLVTPPHRARNIGTLFETAKFHGPADRSNVTVEVTQPCETK